MHPNPSLIQQNGILLDQLHQSTSLWKGEHIVSQKTSLGKGQAINQNCCCCSGEADVIYDVIGVKFVWTNWLFKKYDFQDWLYAPLAVRRKVRMVRGVWESLSWVDCCGSGNDSPPNYPPLHHPLLLHCYPLVLILLLPIIICHRAKFSPPAASLKIVESHGAIAAQNQNTWSELLWISCYQPRNEKGLTYYIQANTLSIG